MLVSSPKAEEPSEAERKWSSSERCEDVRRAEMGVRARV